MTDYYPEVIVKIALLSLLIGCFTILFSCEKIEREAKVNTGTVTDIGTTSASVPGAIIDIGQGINNYGHCWSISSNPIVDNGHSINNSTSDLTAFTSALTNLEPGTTYFVRAYIITKGVPVYSDNTVNFKTLSVTLASVETSAVTITSSTTAISGGNVTDDGRSFVTVKGICWNKNSSANPTVNDSHTSDGSGTGSFTSVMSQLAPDAHYKVRAYATNSAGTAYGVIKEFDTDPAFITDIQGVTYNVVRIGTQLWMKENLMTQKFNDNTTIPKVTEDIGWNDLTTPGFCWFQNDQASYQGTYGALYNWYVVDAASNGGKNICPVGWHVPTDSEWTILTNYLGDINVAGGKMKESGYSHWIYPNTGATNASLFTGLPGAYRSDGIFYSQGVGQNGFWWSSSETSSTNAWDRGLFSDRNSVLRGDGKKKNGISIRCLKD